MLPEPFRRGGQHRQLRRLDRPAHPERERLPVLSERLRGGLHMIVASVCNRVFGLVVQPCMNKRKILALLVAMAAGGVVHGQVSFTGLGDLPGGLFYSWGSSVSADGRAVVGRSNGVAGSVASYHAIRWTREGGMEAVSLPAQWAFGSYAVGTSQDGSVVAGNAFVSAASTTEPFVWTPGGVTLLVGPVNGFGRANRVSADGTTVVGRSAERRV